MNKKIQNILNLVFIIIVVLLLVYCDTKTSELPELPPESTFLMDFEAFPKRAQSKISNYSEDNSIESYNNWGYAAVQVAVWNTFISIGLAIPVASYVEAFNHEPTEQSDGSWLWTYSFSDGYTAELYGSTDDNRIIWEMYISKIDSYTDFLWYQGSSNLGATKGEWTLFDNPESGQPLVGIEWNRDIQTGNADIKYTNIIPNGPENGGYIYYRIINNTNYDAFYDIYNKGENNLINIEWSRSDKYGRVKDFKYYGDNAWHCWDNFLNDIDCL